MSVITFKEKNEKNSSKGGQQCADPRGWTFERDKNVGFGGPVGLASPTRL